MAHGHRENFCSDKEYQDYQLERDKLFSEVDKFILADAELSSNPNLIRVWEFYKAPEIFRTLSECGGDEDWIVYIHKDNEYMKNYGTPFWVERLSSMDTDEYVLPSGATICIASHS